jgi:hypothetical protein
VRAVRRAGALRKSKRTNDDKERGERCLLLADGHLVLVVVVLVVDSTRPHLDGNPVSHALTKIHHHSLEQPPLKHRNGAH